MTKTTKLAFGSGIVVQSVAFRGNRWVVSGEGTHIGSAPDGGRSRPLQRRHLGTGCQSKGQSFEQCVTHLVLALDGPNPFSSNPALFHLDHAVPGNCYQMP